MQCATDYFENLNTNGIYKSLVVFRDIQCVTVRMLFFSYLSRNVHQKLQCNALSRTICYYSRIQYDSLPETMEKYQNPKEADAMSRVQAELDETKIILVSLLGILLQITEK